MQFGVELALLRTPPPLLGGREEQVASCRDEKRDDALTVPLRLMQYICCGNKNGSSEILCDDLIVESKKS